MKHALMLGTTAMCNEVTAMLGTHGFQVTPVFNAKKALHVARILPFDLILTCTTSNPDDRRCLTGEFKRCSPDAFIVLLSDPASGADSAARDGVDEILPLPVTRQALHRALDAAASGQRRRPAARPFAAGGVSGADPDAPGRAADQVSSQSGTRRPCGLPGWTRSGVRGSTGRVGVSTPAKGVTLVSMSSARPTVPPCAMNWATAMRTMARLASSLLSWTLRLAYR
jgi:hypothetical protein